jgi:hypothetical protein
MKKLVGQKNVTLVVDPRKKKPVKGEAAMVGFGDKVQKKQAIRAEMLKL